MCVLMYIAAIDGLTKLANKTNYCGIIFYTVCLTELQPTFGFNNSTHRPGINPQSFSQPPCEHREWFFSVKRWKSGGVKIFLAYTTFSSSFDKPLLILSIPGANFFKIILFYSWCQFFQNHPFLFLVPIWPSKFHQADIPGHAQ